MDDIAFNMSALFVFALAAFAYLGWTYRTRDENEYHTVHRKAGVIRIFASSFTIVGASEFVVFTTLAYLYGWASISFFAGAFAGFFVLALLAQKIRQRGQELDQHSIPDFAAAASLPVPTQLLSLISIVFTCALVLIQVLIGSMLIQILTNTNFLLTAGLLLLGVYSYLFWGGYRSLLYTDVVQGVVLFAFTVGLVFFIVGQGGNDPLTPAQAAPPTSAGISTLVLLFAGGLFAIAGGPEIWQRVLTARDDNVARQGLLASGFTMLIWGVFVVWLGMTIRAALPTANPDNSFFDYLASGLSGWLLGLVLIMLLAAILSTADTELFAAAVITHKQLSRRHRGYHLRIGKTRLIIAILCFLILALSYFTQDVVNIYFGLVYLTFVTGPVALALLFNRGGRQPLLRHWIFSVAIIASLAIFVFLLVNNLFLSWYPLLIIVVASVPILMPGPSVGVRNHGEAEEAIGTER